MNIVAEMDCTKRQLAVERQRVIELEEQLTSLSKFNFARSFSFVSNSIFFNN